METRARRGHRSAVDAARPALARARPSRLQADVRRRPALARRGLSPGDGLGMADRAVYRRLAQSVSWSVSERAPISWRVQVALQRGMCRFDQRDLRLRGPLRATRLRGSGLERRGGLEMLCENVAAGKRKGRGGVRLGKWHYVFN